MTGKSPSDESKSEIYGCNRREYVRRWSGDRMILQFIKPTVKHGEYSGVGHLWWFDYTLTKGKYSILRRHTLLSGLHFCGEIFIQQQDNDQPQSFAWTTWRQRMTQRFLTVMDFPSQSPDLNPLCSVGVPEDWESQAFLDVIRRSLEQWSNIGQIRFYLFECMQSFNLYFSKIQLCTPIVADIIIWNDNK